MSDEHAAFEEELWMRRRIKELEDARNRYKNALCLINLLRWHATDDKPWFVHEIFKLVDEALNVPTTPKH